MMQSEQLTRFYRMYLEWASNGAPQGRPFTRDNGLCWNLSAFCVLFISDDISLARKELAREMEYQFSVARLSIEYPFNTTPENYRQEAYARRCHLNPLRLRWVEHHAQLGQQSPPDTFPKGT